MNQSNNPLPNEKSSTPENFMVYRKKIQAMFQDTPFSQEDLLFNMGLFTRSSVLVKYLVAADLYQRIVNIPGNIYEFGVWWGQNLVLFENLRAIYEPFNKQRHIIGFDTFTGYEDNSYSTETEYKPYLEKLLEAHEGCNVIGQLRNQHRLVEGDVCQTTPAYFEEHKAEIVALAYLDIGTYEATKTILESIKPHVVKGSVILLDQFTWKEMPGEAIAFKETFGDVDVKLEKCQLYPSKTIATIL